MVKMYRGYEIEVRRERCMGGWDLIYYSATRISDGWVRIDSFTDSSDTLATMVKCVKEQLDDFTGGGEED